MTLLRSIFRDPGAIAIAAIVILGFIYLRDILAAMVWLAGWV